MPPRTASYPSRHISAYYEALQSFGHQRASTEGATRIAFHNLLSDVGKRHGFTVLGEQTIQLLSKRTIRLDGEVKDQYKIRRGIWEAKDTGDDLDVEIRKKIAAGYPTKNIIFENTQRAVLFQNGVRVLDTDITQPGNLQLLLDRFFDYSEPLIDEFHQAVAAFRREIPELAKGLTAIIETEKRANKRFSAALDEFLALCRSSLNPATSLEEVEDMLKQHLLTERIFRSVFDNPDFVRRNAIARELEKVVEALTSRAFSRDKFLGQLDYFYRAIENAAQTIDDYSEKQSFLHAVYEQFFQSYSTDTADTHGIVYTPAPIVRWMVASIGQALQREFGLSLGDTGVNILDPCVGTGTFILELMEHIGPSALPHKYAHELHCNEVLLLPYYIAAQNIEHEYYERTGHYAPFEGICFADTLDMARVQADMFAPENTERIRIQEDAPIFVIIGNPPYNAGQANENDNNKNRKYPEIDTRIRDTYVKSSQQKLKRKYYDPYIRFFRWATDRLREKDGMVCFVSNNSFIDVLDGIRKEFAKDFTSIYTLDLGGNVYKNPKLSGTTHNVFGIKVGVAITLLVRNRKGQPQTEPATIHYARVDEYWRKEQKYAYLNEMKSFSNIDWKEVTPNSRGIWLTEGVAEEFDTFMPIGSRDAKNAAAGADDTIFKTYSLGVSTNRDQWVYDFDRTRLEERVNRFMEFYNEQVFRWERRKDKSVSVDDFVQYDDTKIKWSRNLKRDFQRGRVAEFAEDAVRLAIHRPYTKKWMYFADMLIDERGTNAQFFPNTEAEKDNITICLTDIAAEKPFMVIATNHIPDMHIVGAGANAQCFPFYVYDEARKTRRENITDRALARFREMYGTAVTKWDIFYFVYGILHSSEYRSTYALNLKKSLPRIPPVSPDSFGNFVEAGRTLAALHVGYEQAKEYPLRHIENRSVPWTWQVEQMRLSTDKTQLVVNEALTLADIPPAAFDYKLGSRSALEWVIDQYQVSTDKRSGIVSDPNNSDYPDYIVRLVKKVVTVSVETVRLVSELPAIGSENAGIDSIQTG